MSIEPNASADAVSHSRPPDALELAPQLSAFDRAIIRALQEDGRRSFAMIAGDLGVSERAVRMRVHELRTHGVMAVTVVADPRLMGYSTIALVGVRVNIQKGITDIARQLSHVSGAFYVIVATGRYNVLVEMSCIDGDHLLATIDQEISTIDGVTEFEVLPYLRLHYQNPAFEAAIRKVRLADGDGHELPSFEEVDRAILSRLHDDGRTPFQSIARDLHISESQVRARVKRMTNSQAVRIMALTVPRGVGFNTVALIGLKISPGVSIDTVANALAGVPSVIYVAICAGRFDVLAEAVCTDNEHLLRLLDEEIRTVEGVATAEPWIYLQLHYRSVQPAPAR